MIITALDQEKAFDRVSHKFMIQTLQKFGFHHEFIKWIQTLYKNITSKIKVNENLTESIHVGRGVRQGCPLSMALFVICMEPLIQTITKCDQLKGFPLTANTQIKVLVYADDTVLLIRNIAEYNRALKITDLYAKASNSKINNDKTNILIIGQNNIPAKDRKLHPKQNQNPRRQLWQTL